MPAPYTSGLAAFPRAVLYPAPSPAPAVRERPRTWPDLPPDERHLQCVWFDEALRPEGLLTSDGEPVRVEDPGEWNLEAGPDFRGAVIRVGSGERRLAGDVEVHVHPSGWVQHGHRTDPRYAQVRIHVTYHPGSIDPGHLPPGTIQIALRDALRKRAGFSFDQVDSTAYPFARRAVVPPCRAELARWPVDARLQMLDAAGEARLLRKAGGLAARADNSGLPQAVYEEVFAALGYKLNKEHFRRLSRAVPLHILREIAQGDASRAYALLAGVSGLLPERVEPDWDDESRQFHRFIWDAWWRLRERFTLVQMARTDWSPRVGRPVNHPQRRLMAGAALFVHATTDPLAWCDRWTGSVEQMLHAWRLHLDELEGWYFNRHACLGGKPFGHATALLGKDRADALFLNVLLPLRSLLRGAEAFAGGLDGLPPEADNAITRQAALNVLGPHVPPSHLRSGLRRQGLLQIFHDYCLHDRSRCASCPFPTRLSEAWKQRGEADRTKRRLGGFADDSISPAVE